MKHIVLIILIALASVGCSKKDYTCTCYGIAGGIGAQGTVTHYSESQALDRCNEKYFRFEPVGYNGSYCEVELQ